MSKSYSILKQKANEKSTGRYVHKLVGEHFLEKKEDSLHVIHLNYDITDNKTLNLQWATRLEKEKHQFDNPKYKGIRRITNSKLNEGRVGLNIKT